MKKCCAGKPSNSFDPIHLWFGSVCVVGSVGSVGSGGWGVSGDVSGEINRDGLRGAKQRLSAVDCPNGDECVVEFLDRTIFALLDVAAHKALRRVETNAEIVVCSQFVVELEVTRGGGRNVWIWQHSLRKGSYRARANTATTAGFVPATDGENTRWTSSLEHLGRYGLQSASWVRE